MRLFLPGLFAAFLIVFGCTSQPPSSSPPEPTPIDATASETPTSTAVPTETPSPSPTATLEPTPTFSPGRVILPTVAIPTATPTVLPEDAISEKLDQIGVRTAVLRELFSLRRVDRAMITTEELNAHLVENLEDDREDIFNSEAVYKVLGVLEPEDDLYEILLGLLTESVLGFYEPEEEHLYVVSESDELGATDGLTYAHEYVHNLQQQHFDIHTLRESVKENGDKARAFQALVEGDATLVQTIYLFNEMTESEQRDVVEEAQSQAAEAFQTAPYVIRREIEFPYREGFLFIFALFQVAENDWDLVNQAFENVPSSTEQVLHPQRYFTGEAPIEVELSDVSENLGDGWELDERNTFGEFFIRTYLETELSVEDASIAADGWGGDTYALFSGPEDENAVVSKVTWDGEDHAQEFFDTFLNFMSARTETEEWQAHDGNDMTRLIDIEDQIVLININALDTLLIFASDTETAQAIHSALQNDTGTPDEFIP